MQGSPQFHVGLPSCRSFLLPCSPEPLQKLLSEAMQEGGAWGRVQSLLSSFSAASPILWLDPSHELWYSFVKRCKSYIFVKIG